MKFVKKIKDTQFRSTATWGMGMGIQAVYYIILGVLAFIFMPYWWMAFIYMILLPISGIIAYEIRIWFVKTWSRIRYSKSVKKSIDLKKAISLRSELIEMLNNLAR
jgi:hypothetical protein